MFQYWVAEQIFRVFALWLVAEGAAWKLYPEIHSVLKPRSQFAIRVLGFYLSRKESVLNTILTTIFNDSSQIRKAILGSKRYNRDCRWL